MILKVDNELTMLMLTVDVENNVGVPVMAKQTNVSAQGRAAFDSLFRKELRSQTLPILCLCILRQKFESGF